MLLLSQPSACELADIRRLDEELRARFQDRLAVEPGLTRALVSFQANKQRPRYRWFKYKEAFSAELVEHLLRRHNIVAGTILDPFAGSGTALFAASAMGINAIGIEVLPIGQQIVTVRTMLESGLTHDEMATLRRWASEPMWKRTERPVALPELRITRGAYAPETQAAIEQFLAASEQESDRVRAVLRFALLCVLESVSFTRKDGQYLRWDYRSGRRQSSKRFDKGPIPAFEQAVAAKIQEIIDDTNPVSQSSLFPTPGARGDIQLYRDSALTVLPGMPDSIFDAIVTSPPYCNRYDYTRTYALELALLNVTEQELVQLRQEMLSCTVENRAKDLLAINPRWSQALAIADQQPLLQAIVQYLDNQRAMGNLNNPGIPRMVRGYFYEMACIIAESARVLRPQAPLIMVNDNVRYAGVSISVDFILASFAEALGFQVERILVLPNGKGNSSQQMGEHGREALRKCIYVWRRQ